MRFLTYFFSTLIIASGCKMTLPDEEVQLANNSLSTQSLTIPEDFEFDMVKKHMVHITVSNEAGELLSKVPIGVYDGPADRGGILLGSGSTNSMGQLTFELSLSTSSNFIYAYTPYGTIRRSQIIEITGTQTHFTWGSSQETVSGSRRAEPSTFDCKSGFFQVIYGTLKELDVLSGTYLDVGSASSQYNSIGFNAQDNMIYGLKKKGNENIELWRIGTNGQETNLGKVNGYNGANAYKGDFDLNGILYAPYFKNGSWTLYTIDVDASPLSANSSALSELNKVDNTHDFAYNAQFHKFYSMTQNAELVELDHKALTIKTIANYRGEIGRGTFGALWCDSHGDVFMSENGSGNIYKIDIDEAGIAQSISFIMKGEKTSSNDGASCPLSTSPFEDSDGDGVLDGIDEYPEDSTIAYVSYYPAKDVEGAYAFEDLWPLKGDYDFNDLVINFNYEFAKDPTNKYAKLIMRFRVRAIGAGYRNAFGVSFDGLLPSQIVSVSGTQHSQAQTSANGTERGQSKAVIIVFDDGHSLFGASPGTFINSGKQGYVLRDDYEITVEVLLKEAVSELGTINPFIYTRGERGNEIHLLNYPPTDLMNTSLFSQHDDISTPSSGEYYRDVNGMPWALEFPGDFTYPLEWTTIQDAYPKFINWTNSNGSADSDWYKRSNGISDSLFIR